MSHMHKHRKRTVCALMIIDDVFGANQNNSKTQVNFLYFFQKKREKKGTYIAYRLWGMCITDR